MTGRQHAITAIPGDGIGREVLPAAVRVIETAVQRRGATLNWTHLDWGADRYRATGRMMPVDGIEQLSRSDAIFLGAVGDPDIPDVETLWGLLIPIRREFDQYINLRPVRTLPEVPARVISDAPIDMIIVRENVEGEYSEVGGRVYRGRPHEAAIQQTVFTRAGVSRAARFAAELASHRRGLVTSATKSNGIIHTMPFWDKIVAEVVGEHPAVRLEKELIDALAARMVLRPGSLDVIVASNLFGDILSDLAGAVAGSIGVAPSANLDPERRYPSMFEPVHGSAPDIAGRGLANPVGAMWAGAMMLDHLGEEGAAGDLVAAFEHVLSQGTRTADLGGTATTAEFAEAVDAALRRLPPATSPGGLG